MLGVEIEGSDRAELAIRHHPERTTRALVRAINRAMASGRAFMASSIARDVGMKVGDVREALPLTNATLERPEARFAASLKRIPLMKFGARGPRPSRGRGQVTWRVRGSRSSVEGAFIAKMRSGHEGVFKRVGWMPKGAAGASVSQRQSRGAWSMNLPIVELKGPSLGHVFRKFRPVAIVRIMQQFDKDFAHEMRRLGESVPAAPEGRGAGSSTSGLL